MIAAIRPSTRVHLRFRMTGAVVVVVGGMFLAVTLLAEVPDTPHHAGLPLAQGGEEHSALKTSSMTHSRGREDCEVIGGYLQVFLGPDRYRGNAFHVEYAAELYEFTMELDVNGETTLYFSVHADDEGDGIFVRLVDDIVVTVDGNGLDHVSTGPFDVPISLESGVDYALGVAWGSTEVTYGRDISSYPQPFSHGSVLGGVAVSLPSGPPFDPDDLGVELFPYPAAYSMELCLEPVWGACCTQGTCIDGLSQTECEAGPGLFGGIKTLCTDTVCPFGSCCSPDGSCGIVFEVECDGGPWTENGSCEPNVCFVPPSVAGVGGRYLAVTLDAGDPTIPVALRVTAPAYPCLDQYVDTNGLLVQMQVLQTPSEWGTVYVGDEAIVPGTEYWVQTLNANGSGAPATAVTWRWGDANASGIVDLDDILCVLSGFEGNFLQCALHGVDLVGTFFNPDRVVDLDDILAVLSAFAGDLYPGPYPCE